MKPAVVCSPPIVSFPFLVSGLLFYHFLFVGKWFNHLGRRFMHLLQYWALLFFTLNLVPYGQLFSSAHQWPRILAVAESLHNLSNAFLWIFDVSILCLFSAGSTFPGPFFLERKKFARFERRQAINRFTLAFFWLLPPPMSSVPTQFLSFHFQILIAGTAGDFCPLLRLLFRSSPRHPLCQPVSFPTLFSRYGHPHTHTDEISRAPVWLVCLSSHSSVVHPPLFTFRILFYSTCWACMCVCACLSSFRKRAKYNCHVNIFSCFAFILFLVFWLAYGHFGNIFCHYLCVCACDLFAQTVFWRHFCTQIIGRKFFPSIFCAFWDYLMNFFSEFIHLKTTSAIFFRIYQPTPGLHPSSLLCVCVFTLFSHLHSRHLHHRLINSYHNQLIKPHFICHSLTIWIIFSWIIHPFIETLVISLPG